MTSPYTGKKFTRKDALRLEEANDEISALSQFVAMRSKEYETFLDLKVKEGYSRRADPFSVEIKTNDAGVDVEVLIVEVSMGDHTIVRCVPVEFVFSDGSFEKKYREAQEMLAAFASVIDK